jgi:hypothetical protein
MTSWTLDSLGSRKADQLAEHGKLAAYTNHGQLFINGSKGVWLAGQLGNRESEKILETDGSWRRLRPAGSTRIAYADDSLIKLGQ